MGPDKSWKGSITCPSHQAATIITGLWVHCQLEWQLKPGSSCGRWLGSREAGGAGTEASPQAFSPSPPTPPPPSVLFRFHIQIDLLQSRVGCLKTYSQNTSSRDLDTIILTGSVWFLNKLKQRGWNQPTPDAPFNWKTRYQQSWKDIM